MNTPDKIEIPQQLTLRDYFAAKAMQGLLASMGSHDVSAWDDIANDAYGYADAMIAKRKKGDK